MVSFQVQQVRSNVGLCDPLSNPHFQLSRWRTPLGSIIAYIGVNIVSVSSAQIVIIFCFTMKRRRLPIRNDIVNTIELSFDRAKKKKSGTQSNCSAYSKL